MPAVDKPNSVSTRYKRLKLLVDPVDYGLVAGAARGLFVNRTFHRRDGERRSTHMVRHSSQGPRLPSPRGRIPWTRTKDSQEAFLISIITCCIDRLMVSATSSTPEP